MRYMLAAAGCLCLVVTSGCLIPPIPKNFYANKTVLAVRCDARSNVVERLIKKESVMTYVGGPPAWIAEQPSGGSDMFYARQVFVDRTNRSSIRYESLEKIDPDRSYWDWFARDWHFRPILGTNLWAAVHGPCRFYGWRDHGAQDKDVDFSIYVIEPRSVRVKQLSAFAAPGRRGFPELIFDPENQHLTYSTRQGYETCNLLEGTLTPRTQRPEGRALIPRDFGIEDTWDKTVPLEGTNCFVKLKGPRDGYSRSTNSLVITVYTYSRTLSQRTVTTRGFADLDNLRFEEGNRVVLYKSKDDDFAYHVLENRLENRELRKQ